MFKPTNIRNIRIKQSDIDILFRSNIIGRDAIRSVKDSYIEMKNTPFAIARRILPFAGVDVWNDGEWNWVKCGDTTGLMTAYTTLDKEPVNVEGPKVEEIIPEPVVEETPVEAVPVVEEEPEVVEAPVEEVVEEETSEETDDEEVEDEEVAPSEDSGIKPVEHETVATNNVHRQVNVNGYRKKHRH